MKKYIFKIFVILTMIISFYSCTEPYALQTNTFEDAIVVEATITDELKKQEIKITRVYTFEESEPTIEHDAQVYINDNVGNTYEFVENNGAYISINEFKAETNRQYQLFIKTSNGKQYNSTRETLTTQSSINEVNANFKTKFGVDGVEITVNSYDPTNTSKYYRFEYEETYKIISKYWTQDSLIGVYNIFDYNVYFWTQPKSYNGEICYNTEYSNEIIQENTSKYIEDRIDNFPVRFIPQNNHIIANRYSILVKQYVQNIEAYSFYKTLNDLNGSSNLLSPNQPGYIEGNIKNIENNTEKVIGFFDVSSVSSKRIFFNYNDFFEGEPISNYPVDCVVKEYNKSILSTSCEPLPSPAPDYCIIGLYGLYFDLKEENQVYYKFVNPYYYTTSPLCAECNRMWSNIEPPFWQ
jgi:hypothetical protein